MTQHVRRYEIGGLIAQGGMAEILAACAVSEAGVSKRVALKRIRTDRCADPAFVARFFDEARLAVQLSHANVVQVFDFGRTEGDEFFLAMEFVEGVDLQRLRRTLGHQRLPPAEALHLVAQALRGLDYAHRRSDTAGQPLGIVHLDVKPANVLLSFEGEVKVTDFGVARSRDACRPQEGISGTIPFMSPEQARGEKVDLRSDVFSAGVLLHTLLSGSCPFGEEDTARIAEQLRRGAPAPPLSIPEAGRLQPLLDRALSPSLEARFPTAGLFADALEELLFAEGWRSGAAGLRDRLALAFPEERQRLSSLFEPGPRSQGLAVARPASGCEGTFLSRIPEVEAPVRQTQVADTIV
ncbi:MAG: serine/threonine protein kinase, partial [Deltaproteobacteria bacterium]|nr:serine/threonine protein kinase [Deltaproteobacteria bacterium]